MNGSIDAIQAHHPAKLRHFHSSLYVKDGMRLTARAEYGSPDFSRPAGETATRLSIVGSTIELAVNRPEIAINRAMRSIIAPLSMESMIGFSDKILHLELAKKFKSL
jgi:hypothetical protein